MNQAGGLVRKHRVREPSAKKAAVGKVLRQPGALARERRALVLKYEGSGSFG